MNTHMIERLSVLELCAGAGGQSIGLERAGFEHIGAVELDPDAAATLRFNRPSWGVIQADVRTFPASRFRGVDLVAAGIPCSPYTVAGQQLGNADDRDLLPRTLFIVRQVLPKAIVIENVPGLAFTKFRRVRDFLEEELDRLGYVVQSRLIHAAEFGVPQRRRRFVVVALRQRAAKRFVWPCPTSPSTTVGETQRGLMGEAGWPGADNWALRAADLAPTIVGGSRRHGGADLGPIRVKRAWARLGVDAWGIANAPPSETDDVGLAPKLTLRMVAALQGFPLDWAFSGKKTSVYRQIGNAFPPPAAEAIGAAVLRALQGRTSVCYDSACP
jgi:DNA (cytosine-5)-methyltransferase 1